MNHEPLIDVYDDITAYITNEDGFDVALLERVLEKNPCGEPRLTDDEWQSLVNLVNAAPALLDELQRCVKVLQGVVHDTLGDEAGRNAVCATFAISAMAAIDKATK
jgi:hypothetical protein